MIAIKKTSLSFRAISKIDDLASDEEIYTGPPFVFDTDKITPLMVRDANGVRQMTQVEIDARPSQKILAAAILAKAQATDAVGGQRIDALSRALYAALQLLLDDRNMIADRVNGIGTALAAPGATLASVRTAVVTLGAVPKYSAQQFRDAIVAKLTAQQ